MPRPIPTFHGFCGQRRIVETLREHCAGSLQKNQPLPHTLLGGSSGMGKTALAQAVANEMQTDCQAVYASSGTTKLQIAKTLTEVKKADVVFIDESHALPSDSQEILYPAIDVHKAPKIDKEKGRIVENEWVDIPPFTLIVASDQHGKLLNAMMQRLVLRFTLAEYDEPEMIQIVKNYAADLGLLLTSQAARTVAQSCRGVPRRARHILTSIHTCLLTPGQEVTASMARDQLDKLGIDDVGLTDEDRRYLAVLAMRTTPVSLRNLARMCGVDDRALQRDVEPWLMKKKWVDLEARGRLLTPAGRTLVAERGIA